MSPHMRVVVQFEGYGLQPVYKADKTDGALVPEGIIFDTALLPSI
jgi:hypothetical protein